MTSINTSKRDSNIELLRLLLMLSVVILHIFGSNIRNIYGVKGLFYPELLVVGFTIMSVNAFVFISGYNGINFKFKSLIKLVLQILCYSISIYVLSILFLGYRISIKEAVENILPISSALWWFMSSYIALYIISPILNIGFEKLPQKNIKWIVGALLVMNCFSSFLFNNRALGADGYTFFSLMTIYCLARYMKVYKVSFRFPVLIYVLSSLSIFAINAVVCKFSSEVVFPASRYTNPLVVLAAISIFYIFLKIKPFYSTIINKIAGYALAVYLIHTHPIFFSKLKTLTSHIHELDNNLLVILYSLGLGLLIFIICLFIEFVRSYLFKPVNNFIDRKMPD